VEEDEPEAANEPGPTAWLLPVSPENRVLFNEELLAELLIDKRAVTAGIRLGVIPAKFAYFRLEDWILAWALIGLSLARREPEFTKDVGRPLEWDDVAFCQLVFDILQVGSWPQTKPSAPLLAKKLLQRYPDRYGKYANKIPTFTK
jgi:hypothetical protein